MAYNRFGNPTNPELNDWLTDIIDYGKREGKHFGYPEAVLKAVCKVCKDRYPGPLDFTYDVCKECSRHSYKWM